MRSIRVAVLFLAFGVFTLRATRVERLTLADVRDRASEIVLGTIVGTSTRVGDAGMIWTDYRVKVVEPLRGARLAGDMMTVSIAGGSIGTESVEIVAAPRFTDGRTYTFFLETGNRLAVPLVGWGQGVYELIDRPGGGELFVSGDGEPLELSEEGRLTRGPRIRITEGRIAVVANDAHGSARAVEAPTGANADGTAAVFVPAAPPVAALGSEDRRYATLADLRRFIRKQLAEEPRPPRPE